jgi:hypothetical protein
MNEQDKAKADISKMMDNFWFWGRRRFEDLKDAEKEKLVGLLMLTEPIHDRLSDLDQEDKDNQLSKLLSSLLQSPNQAVKDRLIEVIKEMAIKKWKLEIESLFEVKEWNELHLNTSIGEPDHEHTR